MIEKDLNLIRKIVWSYTKTMPGLEFDDLFSEACIVYIAAEKRYDPSRGKKSTFMWHAIKNSLNLLIGKESKIKSTEIPYSERDNQKYRENGLAAPEDEFVEYDFKNIASKYNTRKQNFMLEDPPSEYFDEPETQLLANEKWQELMSALSPEAQAICHLILDEPEIYLPVDRPKLCRGKIRKVLRDRGWSCGKIWASFRELKEVLIDV